MKDVTHLHTFVLCAYGESPYLEECLQSLLSQSVKSRILISTSTPNDRIAGIAAKYGIPYHVRQGRSGITEDWNFGMSLIETPYGTLAHQDDLYAPEYTAQVLARAERSKAPILLFTDYFEVRNGARVDSNRLLKIKRRMNLLYKCFPHSRWMRLRALSLGNSICCPSVTYRMEHCRNFAFDGNFRFACDWDAWDRLARGKGDFLYLSQPLMGHRIHADSETTKQTEGTGRSREEYTMFRRYWPNWIAKRLSGVYAKGADSNQL